MIVKTTYTYVVYHRNDDVPEDIDRARIEAQYGSMIGAVTNVTSKPVDPDQLHNQLVSIGNDGTFFDSVFGNEDDQTKE